MRRGGNVGKGLLALACDTLVFILIIWKHRERRGNLRRFWGMTFNQGEDQPKQTKRKLEEGEMSGHLLKCSQGGCRRCLGGSRPPSPRIRRATVGNGEKSPEGWGIVPHYPGLPLTAKNGSSLFLSPRAGGSGRHPPIFSGSGTDPGRERGSRGTKIKAQKMLTRCY